MSRPVAAGIILGVVALWYLGMWWGWRRRTQRQADLPRPLESLTASADDLTGPVEMTYLGTTAAGEWLNRIVAHGLGRRGAGLIVVSSAGVLIERDGERPLGIPSYTIEGARRDRASAGKVTRTPALVVVTWRLGDKLVETAVRPRHRADLDRLHDAIHTIVASRGASR